MGQPCSFIPFYFSYVYIVNTADDWDNYLLIPLTNSHILIGINNYPEKLS